MSDPDLSIYSFGIGKNAMATAGGALVANIFHEEFAAEATRLSLQSPMAAGERFVSDASRYLGWKGKFSTDEATSEYGYVAMHPLDACLVVEQLRKLSDIIKGRTNHATRLSQKLSLFPKMFGLQSPDHHIFTKLSVKLADKRWVRPFVDWMLQHGIELEEMYVPLHLRPCGSQYQRGPLPKSEMIYPRVLNLPVRPNLTSRELETIEVAIETFGRTHS